MRDDRDLPEGVIDADPAGGWEDGARADGETAERSDAVMSDGWVADIPRASNAAGTRRGGTDVGPVETAEATQGTDPDLATDEQSDEQTDDQTNETEER
ncbi:hypothetical protein AAIB33_12310 [Microbacterium sp. AZCO]|uniref:hypothetical protein n=1 Tax=Microbacterium sp. AZCO TaxID=3142976 RepID=UPI0031F40769